MKKNSSTINTPSPQSGRKIWQFKMPVVYTILLLILTVSIFLWQIDRMSSEMKNELKNITSRNDNASPTIYRYRLHGYDHIKPTLFSDNYSLANLKPSLKSKLTQIIQDNIQKQNITSASVYLRNFENGSWMDINENEGFSPGSLIKVPVMMIYLHEAEKNPNLMKTELYFNVGDARLAPNQTFADGGIQPGKSYSIEFLLHRMIVYSDNFATHLLNLNLNINDFKKLFVEAGLPEPNVFDPNYEITTAGYSRFMRILYNSSYLSKDNSEYALSLLCKSKFKDGLLKNIPDNIEVAHKFGESASGPRDNQVKQLHESGIFYCNDHPYLLTVMTKGKNVKALPDVLSQISAEVYHSIQ